MRAKIDTINDLPTAIEKSKQSKMKIFKYITHQCHTRINNNYMSFVRSRSRLCSNILPWIHNTGCAFALYFIVMNSQRLFLFIINLINGNAILSENDVIEITIAVSRYVVLLYILSLYLFLSRFFASFYCVFAINLFILFFGRFNSILNELWVQ